MINVVGIPLDENSSFQHGSIFAPARIREAYHSSSANYSAESGVDLSQNGQWRDVGDLAFDSYLGIEDGIRDLIKNGERTLAFGGDHSVTYPIIRAYAEKYPNLTILQFDAHPDLYDELDGNRHAHACPFARIMENGLAQRLVQVGIRTLNPHQKAQAERFGVEIVSMRDWSAAIDLTFDTPLYISLDLDVLDPAFAPGISHHEPGGFSTRQLLTMIQNINANIVGADLVELNPLRDINDMTAMVAAKVFKELLAKMLAP